MKNVKWQECASCGATAPRHATIGKIPSPSDSVMPKMKVSARYRDLDVYLTIENQIQDQEGVFAATVLFFEPVLSEKPDDLSQGDEVRIDRQHICWLHEN